MSPVETRARAAASAQAMGVGVDARGSKGEKVSSYGRRTTTGGHGNSLPTGATGSASGFSTKNSGAKSDGSSRAKLGEVHSLLQSAEASPLSSQGPPLMPPEPQPHPHHATSGPAEKVSRDRLRSSSGSSTSSLLTQVVLVKGVSPLSSATSSPNRPTGASPMTLDVGTITDAGGRVHLDLPPNWRDQFLPSEEERKKMRVNLSGGGRYAKVKSAVRGARGGGSGVVGAGFGMGAHTPAEPLPTNHVAANMNSHGNALASAPAHHTTVPSSHRPLSFPQSRPRPSTTTSLRSWRDTNFNETSPLASPTSSSARSAYSTGALANPPHPQSTEPTRRVKSSVDIRPSAPSSTPRGPGISVLLFPDGDGSAAAVAASTSPHLGPATLGLDTSRIVDPRYRAALGLPEVDPRIMKVPGYRGPTGGVERGPRTDVEVGAGYRGRLGGDKRDMDEPTPFSHPEPNSSRVIEARMRELDTLEREGFDKAAAVARMASEDNGVARAVRGRVTAKATNVPFSATLYPNLERIPSPTHPDPAAPPTKPRAKKALSKHWVEEQGLPKPNIDHLRPPTIEYDTISIPYPSILSDPRVPSGRYPPGAPLPPGVGVEFRVSSVDVNMKDWRRELVYERRVKMSEFDPLGGVSVAE
ncbi:hypothetical protein M427DRAFT_44990 [Gonapodya prolifera JEL478]|uniref:Uncharacterized protein n=1 Tax=Gonapodya prolifera (strain JEL478) TaxID=1344416 RepID=A0A139ADS8_GONPJ|nr:hypothetical protein M427DRAFT_44990 [Gonapodya prolifera JEL478]|eukprot:KXS14595.1 hypothetical protein M427DRAFT_44990 [Gonapodya prolifera JEL478]